MNKLAGNALPTPSSSAAEIDLQSPRLKAARMGGDSGFATLLDAQRAAPGLDGSQSPTARDSAARWEQMSAAERRRARGIREGGESKASSHERELASSGMLSSIEWQQRERRLHEARSLESASDRRAIESSQQADRTERMRTEGRRQHDALDEQRAQLGRDERRSREAAQSSDPRGSSSAAQAMDAEAVDAPFSVDLSATEAAEVRGDTAQVDAEAAKALDTRGRTRGSRNAATGEIADAGIDRSGSTINARQNAAPDSGQTIASPTLRDGVNAESERRSEESPNGTTGSSATRNDSTRNSTVRNDDPRNGDSPGGAARNDDARIKHVQDAARASADVPEPGAFPAVGATASRSGLLSPSEQASRIARAHARAAQHGSAEEALPVRGANMDTEAGSIRGSATSSAIAMPDATQLDFRTVAEQTAAAGNSGAAASDSSGESRASASASTERTSAAAEQASGLARLRGSIDAPVGSPAFGPELAEGLRSMVARGHNEARLNLNPLALGPMDIDLSIDADGNVRVRLDAAHEDTRRAAGESTGLLAQMLESDGMRLDRFDITAPGIVHRHEEDRAPAHHARTAQPERDERGNAGPGQGSNPGGRHSGQAGQSGEHPGHLPSHQGNQSRVDPARPRRVTTDAASRASAPQSLRPPTGPLHPSNTAADTGTVRNLDIYA